MSSFFQDGPSGLFNATPILKVPIFYSWPHFYLADPSLSTHYTGVREANESDKSYLDIQPIIGANCHMSRKIQGNMAFGNLRDPLFTRINLTDFYYFPCYWMEASVEITDDQANEMKTSLAFYDTAKVGSKAILYSCSIISPILFGIAVYILWRRRNYWKRVEGELLSFGADDTDGNEDIHIGYQHNSGKNDS